MTAIILDGTALARATRERLAGEAAEVAAARGRPPSIAFVLVGDDPASGYYIRSKGKAARSVGIDSRDVHLPATATQSEVEGVVAGLSADPGVDGVLVQLPLPDGLAQDPVIMLVDPAKDVDGLHPVNAGRLAAGRRDGLRPCTPLGVMALLADGRVPTAGAEALVIGRSILVGRPTALLLLEANATVTIAHSRTVDLAAVARRSDIIVAAVGSPALVRGDWVKPDAAVIDVGVSRVDGAIQGDVAFDEVAEVAGWITPMPGGTGPMTIAMLLANTVQAARGAAA